IAAIRARVVSGEPFQFRTPEVVPQRKEPQGHTYRPVARRQLDDKIVESLTARYLRDALDPALSESCLAFRSGQPGHPPPTTADPLNTIVTGLEAQQGAGPFVAEADIKGFFDCIPHDVARKALQRLIADRQKQTPSLQIHPRALAIFEAYLSAYSFESVVLG